MKRSWFTSSIVTTVLLASTGGERPTPVAASTVAKARAATAQPQFVLPLREGLLYVSNLGNNSITVYSNEQRGNAAPLYVIAGSKTGLSDPGQLSQDASGNLYVANGSWRVPGTNPSILVFAHGANGNVSPIRILRGPRTGIHNVQAMTVDSYTGKIFVVDQLPTSGLLSGIISLLRFPPNSYGDAIPFAIGRMANQPVIQITSDSTGQNLIYAHYAGSPNADGFGVGTVAKQFPNGGYVSGPGYSLGLFPVSGIVDDPVTRTYLVTTPYSQYGIARLAENTVGFGGFNSFFKPPIVSTLTSETCGVSLALGFDRDIYVVHDSTLSYGYGPGPCPTDAVYVYEHDASGNAQPVRVLTGAATRLNQPFGIYVGY